MAGNDESTDDPKKPHRERLSGRKAQKKKFKKDQNPDDKQRNPKAFTFNSAIRAERKFRRTQDLKSKKEHIPLIDRTPLEPPPILVAVVGPPKVGKSSLIRCLIKSYTRQGITKIKGPVTVVSGKKRRITLMECNNDINSMVDVAKVADLVLLLIDASFGFEMEIFEFLNICQVHGMPKIMGVLTHLDMIKHTKKLQRTKKQLKRRFWTEVFAGAKLFYLSGIMHGEYLRNEIKNLARFISVMKFRPLVWQTTHPYVLADRMEDLTPPEQIRVNPKVNRTVSLYGFMRGIPMNQNTFIHIPGCGDFPLNDISFLPDPCPLPQRLKKRSLIEKERLVYAPFSGVGGIVYDKDAVYIEVNSNKRNDQSNEPSNELVNTLLETKETIDVKLAQSRVQLFSDTKPILSSEFEQSLVKGVEQKNRGNDTNEQTGKAYNKSGCSNSTKKRKRIVDNDGSDSNDDDSDNEDNDESGDDHTDDEEDDTHIDDEEDDTHIDDEEDDSHIDDAKDDTKDDSDEDDDNSDGYDNNEDDDDISAAEEEKVDLKKEKFAEGTADSLEEEINLDGTSESIEKSLVENVHQREEAARYKAVLSEKDKKIHNSITEALASLQSQPVTVKPENWSECSSSDEEENEDNRKNKVNIPWENEINADESDSGDSDIEMEGTDLNWKSNLAEKAAMAFIERQSSTTNLWKLVYGNQNDFENKDEQNSEEENEVGGLFKLVTSKQQNISRNKETLNAVDSSKFILVQVRDWNLPSVQSSIKDCFVTGKWKKDDANELLQLDDMNDSEDEELFGDFEDLETGQKFEGKPLEKEGESSGPKLTKEELLEKKKKLKEKFDEEYDTKDEKTYFEELKTEVTKQAELNRKQFEGLEDEVRVKLEGFRSGMYVRIEIKDTPSEFVENFDPSYPLIVGGLQPGEQNVGYVKVRIKKHRWYGKILKTKDPLIISMGWRRFQTVVVYSKQEDNMRHRMLKYTPEHVACMGHFWGPITRTGTGFLTLQSVSNEQAQLGFRIAATGSVVDTNQSTTVTKKLKLTGVPLKVYKKTAFIKGMFNSSLEVAKFEGAKIKTVSGIRGQIKKAVNKPEGTFRATFEDKILLSDIVFCRTWYKVDIPRLYIPVTSLLLPPEIKNSWKGMKTVGQLKREGGLKNEAQPDSMYTEIQRRVRVPKPLVVPRALEKELPYRFKTKINPVQTNAVSNKKQLTGSFSKKLSKIVVRDEYESKVASMMDKLRMSFEVKQEKLKEQMHKRILQHRKEVKADLARKNLKMKQTKKEIFKTLSKQENSGKSNKFKKRR